MSARTGINGYAPSPPSSPALLTESRAPTRLTDSQDEDRPPHGCVPRLPDPSFAASRWPLVRCGGRGTCVLCVLTDASLVSALLRHPGSRRGRLARQARRLYVSPRLSESWSSSLVRFPACQAASGLTHPARLRFPIPRFS